MKNPTMLRLGSSALLLGLVAVGCTPGGHPASLSSVAPQGVSRQAAKVAKQAEVAIAARNAVKAVPLAEQAVALSPRDARYRAMLGQAYLLAGRFTSAQASFADAVTLDPQPRARFNLALTQVALGTWDVARTTLAGLNGAIPDADLGLATTLAGDRDGGLVILERAARAKDASMKARQNLALAYALAGRWNDAQAVAAQDVPADQLPHRLSQWAQFAQPRSSWDQVASLLGVTPAEDPGRPAALALADPAPAAPVAVAQAAASAMPAEPAQPTVLAAADPVPVAPVAAVVPAVQTTPVPGGVSVALDPAPVAAPSLTEDAPQIAAAPSPAHHVVPAAAVAATTATATAPQAVAQARPRPAGRWVVQLGAYTQAGAVQTAWSRFTNRIWALAGYEPARSTFVVNSGTVHRLTMSGFATRGEAQRMCTRIKSRGGNCFVRAAAGEQPMQWARGGSATQVAMR